MSLDPGKHASCPAGVCRLRVAVHGAVQGVGFRPFVYRLATELGLAGWVNNSAQGVLVEVDGSPALLQQFLARLESEKPPRSFIQSLEPCWLDAAGYSGFQIRPSDPAGSKTALVLPDIATCPECLREILDPANRRYFYPFTNCTHCGPRFSIIEALPYDRSHTSMKQFRMCPRCQAEYDNPLDRRFHAQPNACPECGPHLELWDKAGQCIPSSGLVSPPFLPAAVPEAARPLLAAAEALRAGRILALKGLGGFHLLVAAHDETAVERLRRLKHREEKPFALMFPDLESVRAACELSPQEERLLRAPECPIVLLRRRASAGAALSALLAPDNPFLGAMLPYTPLHLLLLKVFGGPVVATSGNLSDEPICTDEREALSRLNAIADLFLVHNRPIVRHVDDSIVRIVAGRELVLRRARGYAPLPLLGGGPSQEPVLALGGHLKNTVSLAVGSQVFVSQHIGDLETAPAFEAFERVIRDFKNLYAQRPGLLAADAHPDYVSAQWALRQKNVRVIPVQHHLAHVLSCMAENELAPPCLGVAWDGTGYGLDGAIWGGEFFEVNTRSWKRLAALRPFRLPGGEAAVREPRRCALGLLYALWGEAVFEQLDLAPLKSFSSLELRSLRTMLQRGLNSPLTTSVGRLFDAVAAVSGLRQRTRFEGQAAMQLEYALSEPSGAPPYSLPVRACSEGDFPAGLESPGQPSAFSPAWVVDWAPALEALLSDLRAGLGAPLLSARFHNGLAEALVAVARRSGYAQVALSGGCFQNRYLVERTVLRLQQEGFRPYWHQRVPPNDGGISLGQVIAARRQTV